MEKNNLDSTLNYNNLLVDYTQNIKSDYIHSILNAQCSMLNAQYSMLNTQ